SQSGGAGLLWHTPAGRCARTRPGPGRIFSEGEAASTSSQKCLARSCRGAGSVVHDRNVCVVRIQQSNDSRGEDTGCECPGYSAEGQRQRSEQKRLRGVQDRARGSGFASTATGEAGRLRPALPTVVPKVWTLLGQRDQ